MGELRRLNLEWNGLVETARSLGIRRVDLTDLPGRTVRVVTRQHFRMSRVEARSRVSSLRSSVAQFYSPTQGEPMTGFLDSFGVEIETFLPQGTSPEQAAAAIRAAEVMCQAEGSTAVSVMHATRDYWKVVRDFSLERYNPNGREFVSPPLLGEVGMDNMRKVARALTIMGCDSNHLAAGLHVHVGVTRYSNIEVFKNILRIFSKWDAAIDSFMAESRRNGGRNNGWCRQVTGVDSLAFERATNLDQLMDAVGQPHRADPRSPYRYRKVNLLAHKQNQSTIEFRQHQGTCEPKKIEHWTRFVLRAVAKAAATTAEEINHQDSGLEAVLNFIGCEAAEKAYFLERREYFSQRATRQRRST
jgi:hypothetical protein